MSEINEPNPALQGTAITELEARATELDPGIVSALRDLGSEAIEAYASLRLFHNTMGDFVPRIVQEGLQPENSIATPDNEDVDFAEELFETKGNPMSSKSSFDIYLKGTRNGRKPGVFFYGSRADSLIPYNAGYGQPERMFILAREMGGIVAQEGGPFSETERAKARRIFYKYSEIVNGGESGHVVVLAANPFSPPIFNERLANLASAELPDIETAVFILGRLGLSDFEGIYIPGTIPPEDLIVVESKLPIQAKLIESEISPSHSRFFYTPPHLQRIQ